MSTDDATYDQPFYNNILKVDKYVQILIKLDDIRSFKVRDKKNLALYIFNLLCSKNSKIAIIRSHDWFDEHVNSDWHTIRLALKAQKILVEEGLVKIKSGYKNEGYIKGYASIMTATKKFYRIFGKIKIKDIENDNSGLFDIIYKEHIKPEDIPDEYAFEPYDTDTSFKVLEDGKQYYINEKINIHTLKKKRLSLLEVWLKKMYVLNHLYFNKIVLGFDDKRNVKIVKNVYLTRIFTGQGCGRFFQQHGSSYQNIKKEDRKHLTINGKKTVEVDYESLHINLLYAEKKVQNTMGDCYTPIVRNLIKKNDTELRDAITLSILIALNTDNTKAFVGALNSNKAIHSILNKFKVKPSMILKEFSQVHSTISDTLNSNASIRLQYMDSKIIQEVLLRLKREDILGIPLHDSIITQKKNGKKVKEIMEQIYRKETGFNITATIKKK
jgi:hypothetical protein